MFRLICNLPEYNIRTFDPLKIPLSYEVNNEKSNDNFALKI